MRQAITEAAGRIEGRVRRTPTLEIAAGELAEVPVILKLEQMQHGGSFKCRGAFNTLLSATLPSSGVIAASGGNHGIAVALAARSLGVAAEIFVPTISSRVKVRKLAALGARVHEVGRDYAEALEAMRERQATTGALDVHAYDQPTVVAGQGTLARELDEQAPDVSEVLIAVGGGGLIGGALGWFEDRKSVIAVEPEGAPTLGHALEAGEPVDVEVGGIAADSLGARRIGRICFDLARRFGTERVAVTDEAIRHAQGWLFEHCRIMAEPGGATALAALMSGAVVPSGKGPVAVVVCGGNASLHDLEH